ncbi:MAG: hypothetical protein KDH94_06570, partial [Coxiellaceae bacterium]|nr:hypothetical protein [Coxiellaceae bacterium]
AYNFVESKFSSEQAVNISSAEEQILFDTLNQYENKHVRHHELFYSFLLTMIENYKIISQDAVPMLQAKILEELPNDVIHEWKCEGIDFNGTAPHIPNGYLAEFTHAITSIANHTLTLRITSPSAFLTELAQWKSRQQTSSSASIRHETSDNIDRAKPLSGFQFFANRFGLTAAKAEQQQRKHEKTDDTTENTTAAEITTTITWLGGLITSNSTGIHALDNAEQFLYIDEVSMLKQKCPSQFLAHFCGIRAINKGNNCVQNLSGIHLTTTLKLGEYNIETTLDRELKISQTPSRILLGGIASDCGRYPLLVSVFFIKDGLHQQATAAVQALKRKCQQGVTMNIPQAFSSTFRF